MLSPDEKHALTDPDGPLGGALLFDSVFRDDLELANAFIEFCKHHRPAIFIDWTHSPDGDVLSLERETGDFGETIDAFLEWLPKAQRDHATQALKVALHTEHIPTIRRSSLSSRSSPRDRIRVVQDLIDRIGYVAPKDHVPKDDMAWLFVVLKSFVEPPVDVQQWDALLEKLGGLLNRESVTGKDFQPILFYLRFNFPHHEPLLKDFRRWINDPNRTQVEICEVTQTDWLDRLKTMDVLDRETAARALERVLTAPEYTLRCQAITTALRG